MFGLFKKKEKELRSLKHFKELQVKDLVTFKPRSTIPDTLQAQTLTVTAVQGYQYDDGIAAEFVLEMADGSVFTAMCSDDEDGDNITLSKKLSRAMVSELFEEGQLGSLFEEGDNNRLDIIEGHQSETLQGWLPSHYLRTIFMATAYFYKEDRRLLGASDYADDGSEELRYSELEGNDDVYSLNIEVWDGGETDIFVQKTIPHHAISDLWPHG